ncbi:hypothetical protein C7C45_33380, partial [Micromonospora arborensis]
MAEDDPVSDGVAVGRAEPDSEVDGLGEPDGDWLAGADSEADADGLAEPPLIRTSRALSVVTVTVTVCLESL